MENYTYIIEPISIAVGETDIFQQLIKSVTFFMPFQYYLKSSCLLAQFQYVIGVFGNK